MSILNSVIRQKISEEFTIKSQKQRLTNAEFVDKLKKSKCILFRTDFDDVRIFVSGFGTRFNIIKVKRGVVKTSVDGISGYRKIEVEFLKKWFDEFKLNIE